MKTIPKNPRPIFRTLKAYPGYSINQYGEIKSKMRSESIIIARKIDGQGYPCATLCINHKNTTKKIHQLMAMAWYPKKYELYINNPNMVINHKDGNKLNTHVSNFEICTQKHNINEAIRLGQKCKMSDRCQRDTPRAVVMISPEGIVTTERSLFKAAELLDVSVSAIYNCCTGRQKTAKGWAIVYK